jgi:hypothetical protein
MRKENDLGQVWSGVQASDGANRRAAQFEEGERDTTSEDELGSGATG